MAETIFDAVAGSTRQRISGQFNIMTIEVNAGSIASHATTNTGWFDAPSGYTPICARYRQIEGGLGFSCSLAFGTNNQWIVSIENINSSASTCHGYVDIICIKT